MNTLKPESRTDGNAPPPQPRRPLRRLALLGLELSVLLVLVGVLTAIFTNKLHFEKVISPSMDPTLQVGDVLMTDSSAVPRRYDIICFTDPSPGNEGDLLVKRLMGLPGDKIMLDQGVLSINGQEEYSAALPENQIYKPDRRLRVPTDHLFVLGDNRNDSADSLDYGPVPYDNLRGVVLLIVWPPERWGRPRALH